MKKTILRRLDETKPRPASLAEIPERPLSKTNLNNKAYSVDFKRKFEVGSLKELPLKTKISLGLFAGVRSVVSSRSSGEIEALLQEDSSPRRSSSLADVLTKKKTLQRSVHIIENPMNVRCDQKSVLLG